VLLCDGFDHLYDVISVLDLTVCALSGVFVDCSDQANAKSYTCKIVGSVRCV